jgi:hypothetical protein
VTEGGTGEEGRGGEELRGMRVDDEGRRNKGGRKRGEEMRGMRVDGGVRREEEQGRREEGAAAVE